MCIARRLRGGRVRPGGARPSRRHRRHGAGPVLPGSAEGAKHSSTGTACEAVRVVTYPRTCPARRAAARCKCARPRAHLRVSRPARGGLHASTHSPSPHSSETFRAGARSTGLKAVASKRGTPSSETPTRGLGGSRRRAGITSRAAVTSRRTAKPGRRARSGATSASRAPAMARATDDQADDRGVAPAHRPVARLAPGAQDGDRDDREERGRLGAELGEAQDQRQRGHEDDPAAHAEEAGQCTLPRCRGRAPGPTSPIIRAPPGRRRPPGAPRSRR